MNDEPVGAAALRTGDHVRVRQQRWLITDIRTHEKCSVLTLSGLGPANRRLERQILTPFDRVESLAFRRTFRIVRPRRWRRTCRQLIADTGPASMLRTARTARMDLLPHQLEPALAIVEGRGTRVLIADEVGLGKTVQAGLIAAELKSRGAVGRLLVLTPAGLREQWVEELSNRFNLALALFDFAAVARRRAALPVGVNPWAVEPAIVTSIDFIKRVEVRPAVESCRWDLVIVDEAHHAATATDRHDVVQSLCGRAAYVVLLTATPHNGDPQAFASLCALGERGDELLAFRRTRRAIGFFDRRRVHQLHVRPGPAERAMHASVDGFVRAVQREPGGRDQTTALALATLRKRALSSAYALQQTVDRRLSTLNHPAAVGGEQLALPLFDISGEFESADAAPDWTIPALRDANHERALLTRMLRAATAAIGHESKIGAIRRLLRRIREPIVIFTEYRDTLAHLVEQVAADATLLHGGLSRDERRRALDRFSRGGVLLATDAAGEGLNLHHGCRIVVNLELPWNPTRLEQRIGRVDRIGQRRCVHAFHLIAAGTAEMRILQLLGMRIARARADIGAANPLDTVDSSDPTHAAPTMRMDAEARAEHDRLAFARLLLADGPTINECGRDDERHALVSCIKRRGIRSRLKSEVLIVWRSTLTDDHGQSVAHYLGGIQLQNRRTFLWSLQVLDALIGDVALSDEAHRRWAQTSRSTHHAFWSSRLLREQAIAAGVTDNVREERQPGLFDARATRAWIERDQQRSERIELQRQHIDQATRMAAIDSPTAQAVLVLFTR